MNTIRRMAVIGMALSAICGSAMAATPFPDRPITLLVPTPPGGTTDTIARLLANRLGSAFGQSVVVENRSGGATTIAGQALLNQPADGHTVLLATFSTIANPYLMKSVPYTFRDFDPVSLVVNTPNVLIAGPAVTYSSLAELIADARARPGSVTFASTSNGGSPHLSGELFNSMAGVDIRHIPYPGSAPAMTSLLGGHVSVMYDNLPSALGQIQAGKVRPLAVTTSQRVPVLADVPTFAEQGYPEYEVNAWFGLLAKKGTPPAILETWHTEVRKALAAPEVQERLTSLGAIIVGNSPAEFTAYLEAEDRKWSQAIKAANIQPE
jgi:tripartite-type tricarboxylate transporter receptor subunit TctC